MQSRDADARTFARLFLMPGVLHCGGGAGPDDVDWTTAIADWVEHAKAPDQVTASKRGPGGVVTRTRPLCVYPQRAEYKGTGSTDEASNFVCR